MWQQIIAVVFIVVLNLLPIGLFVVNAVASGLASDNSSAPASEVVTAQRLATLLRQLTSTGVGTSSGSTDLGEVRMRILHSFIYIHCSSGISISDAGACCFSLRSLRIYLLIPLQLPQFFNVSAYTYMPISPPYFRMFGDYCLLVLLC